MARDNFKNLIFINLSKPSVELILFGLQKNLWIEYLL